MEELFNKALAKRKGRGIDLTIIVGKPSIEEQEQSKMDPEHAPKPTERDLSEMSEKGALGGGEGEASEMGLMEAMAALEKKKEMPEEDFSKTMEDEQQSVEDLLTDMGDLDKEDMMSRKPRSLGERIRQMAMKKKGSKEASAE